MHYVELSNAQRRQLLNSQQAYTAWEDATKLFHHSYRETMRWMKAGGRDYLYKCRGRIRKSLGPRSVKTEVIFRDYTSRRNELRSRLKDLTATLDTLRPVNRAYLLGRVPNIAADILRELQIRDMLGTHAIVAGTNALYAYEAHTGVLFNDDLTATEDLDILWDTRNKLTLIAPDDAPAGLLAIMRSIDPTFTITSPFRVQNSKAYMVDFIRPERRDEALRANKLLTHVLHDIEPAPIAGLDWLLSAPKMSEIAIAANGLPVRVIAPDPRVFALHKFWLSSRAMRNPVKRIRDKQQAAAVMEVIKTFTAMEFDLSFVKSLPPELKAVYSDLKQIASK